MIIFAKLFLSNPGLGYESNALLRVGKANPLLVNPPIFKTIDKSVLLSPLKLDCFLLLARKLFIK